MLRSRSIPGLIPGRPGEARDSSLGPATGIASSRSPRAFERILPGTKGLLEGPASGARRLIARPRGRERGPAKVCPKEGGGAVLSGEARDGGRLNAAHQGGRRNDADQMERPLGRNASGRVPHAPLRLGHRGLRGNQGLKESPGEVRPIEIEDLKGQKDRHGGNGAGHDRPPRQGFHRKNSPQLRLPDQRRAPPFSDLLRPPIARGPGRLSAALSFDDTVKKGSVFQGLPSAI
jgi:hypothetical protein